VAYLRVANSGEVIPDSAVGELAEPFYRLAGRTGDGGGFGLGLSIAKSVSSAHGATMTVTNPADGGLDVVIRMPPPAQPWAAGNSPAQLIPPAGVELSHQAPRCLALPGLFQQLGDPVLRRGWQPDAQPPDPLAPQQWLESVRIFRDG